MTALEIVCAETFLEYFKLLFKLSWRLPHFYGKIWENMYKCGIYYKLPFFVKVSSVYANVDLKTVVVGLHTVSMYSSWPSVAPYSNLF